MTRPSGILLMQMNEGPSVVKVPLVVKVATPARGTRRSDWPNPYYEGSLSGPASAPATVLGLYT